MYPDKSYYSFFPPSFLLSSLHHLFPSPWIDAELLLIEDAFWNIQRFLWGSLQGFTSEQGSLGDVCVHILVDFHLKGLEMCHTEIQV